MGSTPLTNCKCFAFEARSCTKNMIKLEARKAIPKHKLNATWKPIAFLCLKIKIILYEQGKCSRVHSIVRTSISTAFAMGKISTYWHLIGVYSYYFFLFHIWKPIGTQINHVFKNSLCKNWVTYWLFFWFFCALFGGNGKLIVEILLVLLLVYACNNVFDRRLTDIPGVW